METSSVVIRRPDHRVSCRKAGPVAVDELGLVVLGDVVNLTVLVEFEAPLLVAPLCGTMDRKRLK